MKQIILTVAAVFAFGFVNAQEKEVKEIKEFGFSQGNIFIEGQLNFTSSKETNSFKGTDLNEEKISTLGFSPKLGYFVDDKFAVGVSLNLTSGKTTMTDFTPNPDNVVETKNNGFGAGVFARYYFLNLGERFKTYSELGVGFGSTKHELNSVETSKDKTLRVGLDLGMNYFLTKDMAISFGLTDVLSFNSNTNETPAGGESKTNSINGNLNVFNNFFNTPTFGLLYKF